MKRITLLTLLILAIGTAGAFAQQFSNESDMYVKTLAIHKIYPHSDGYKIEYIRQDYSLGSFWAPTEWFRGTDSKGAVAYGKGEAYPYVSFFYTSGEFSHFRLYLIESVAHGSWGVLDPTVDYSGEYPDPESSPEISY